MENGNSAFSIDWALVQPEVARFTRICTYDRAGDAWSEDGPTKGTVEQSCDDLHLLLRKAGIRPPYILVGASIGGIYTRAYQRRYPEEAAGLILDDSTSDEGMSYMVDGKDKPIYDMTAADMREAFKPLLSNPPKQELPTKLEEPFDRLPPNLRPLRLWASRKFVANRDIHDALVSTESWREEFIALRRLRLEKAHPLGSPPLIVLGRNQSDNEKRQRHLKEMTALSSAGKLVMAGDSGHEIHIYRPDLVVLSIREVVRAVRTKKQ